MSVLHQIWTSEHDGKGSNADVAGESTQLSLSQIVKEVAQQQHQQTIEAEKSKSFLTNLQAQLFELEKENKVILQEIRSIEKQIYHLENESESHQQHCADLEAELWNLNANNFQLKFAIQEEEEKYFRFLDEYDKYRKKMLAHKELTNQLESRSPIMMQLEEKELVVKELKAKKEELAADLMNPEENIIKQVQGEITELKAKISELREAINKKSVLVIKEEEHHVQLRKEIEVTCHWLATESEDLTIVNGVSCSMHLCPLGVHISRTTRSQPARRAKNGRIANLVNFCTDCQWKVKDLCLIHRAFFNSSH